MKQTLHIFRKDVLYLRREICLELIITAILGWAETASLSAGAAEILWMLAAAFLIARVVHAEAIPGYNQFWITRPYRWTSLLTAKILFVLLFVNLPLVIAEAYVVRSAHFPLLPHLPGLLWSQALMLLCFSLPISALAAMTTGIASFLFSSFVLLTLGFIGSSGILSIPPIAFVFFNQAATPTSVDWVRLSLAICATTTAAAIAVYVLYQARQTRIGRICAVSGALIAAALYFYTPWSMALAVQSRLSRQVFDGSSLKVALDPSHREPPPSDGRMTVTKAKVVLPLSIANLSPDLELQADSVSVRLQSKDGKTWNSGFAGVNQKMTDDGASRMSVYLLIDSDFFEEEKDRPVTAHAVLYLTIFGEPKQRTIQLQGRSVDGLNGLRCGIGMLDQLYCRSVFRWPRSRIYAQFGSSGKEAFTPNVSYSPFAANLDFNPVERHWISTPRGVNEATITSKEPLSHFRKDVEFEEIRLADFTGPTGVPPVRNK